MGEDKIGDPRFELLRNFRPQTVIARLCPVTDDIHIVEAENFISEQVVHHKCLTDSYGIYFCTSYVSGYVRRIHAEQRLRFNQVWCLKILREGVRVICG